MRCNGDRVISPFPERDEKKRFFKIIIYYDILVVGEGAGVYFNIMIVTIQNSWPIVSLKL